MKVTKMEIKNNNFSDSKKLEIARILSIFSIFQLYVGEIFGISLSVFLLLNLYASRNLFSLFFIKGVYQKLVFTLILYQALSIIWARDQSSCIRDLYFGVIFLIFLLLLRWLSINNRQSLVMCARTYVVAAAAQSFAVIVFRLYPSIEQAFYQSIVAKFVISDKVLTSLLLGDSQATVSDPDKAGGFLLAANVAGAWSLCLGLLSLSLASRRDWTKGYFIALLHFAAAIASGSKISLFLTLGSLVLLIIITTIHNLPSFSRGIVKVYFMVAMPFLIAVAFQNLAQFSFFEAWNRALGSRQVMWDFALHQFALNPILGLGYGGWTEAFYGIGQSAWADGANGNLAPHNMFIILWYQSGIFAMFMGLLIVICGIFVCIRAIQREPLRCTPLFFAYCAYFFQAQGENYAIYGDAHISICLAFIVSLMSCDYGSVVFQNKKLDKNVRISNEAN